MQSAVVSYNHCLFNIFYQESVKKNEFREWLFKHLSLISFNIDIIILLSIQKAKNSAQRNHFNLKYKWSNHAQPKNNYDVIHLTQLSVVVIAVISACIDTSLHVFISWD